MKKKYIRWILWTLASPFILFFIVCILLYIPPIQNFLVDKAAKYASEKTNMNIEVGHISLSFPLNLVVNKVEATSAQKDTVFSIGELQLNVRLLPLFEKKVTIDGIYLNDAEIHSNDLIHGMTLDGTLGKMFLSSHSVELDPEKAIINNFTLKDADFALCINDTTKQDTTPSKPTYWKFLLEKADLKNVKFSYQVPQEDLFIKVGVDAGAVRNGYADLHKSQFSVKSLYINNGMFVYKTPDELKKQEKVEGINYSDIELANVGVNINSVFFKGSNIKANIDKLTFLEKNSGLNLVSCEGSLLSNSQKIVIPSLKLKTDNSQIEFNSSIDWTSLEKDGNGNMTARLFADIGKQDVIKFIGAGMDKDFLSKYPSLPLRLRTGIDGNMKYLKVTTFNATLPTALDVNATGALTNLLDSIRRGGMVSLEAKAGDTRFLESMTGGFIIPEGTSLEGRFSVNGNQTKADMLLKQASARRAHSVDTLKLSDDYIHSLRAKGDYNISSQAYNLDAVVNRINVHEFMPHDSIFNVTATLDAKGKGFDFLSSNTYLDANAKIQDLHYGKYNLGGIDLNVFTKKNNTEAALKVKNKSMDISAIFAGLLSRKNIDAQLDIDIKKLDWHDLGLVDSDLTTSQQLSATLKTNLKQKISLLGSMTNTSLLVKNKTYKTKDLFLGFFTESDSTHSYVQAGDLDFRINCKNNINKLSGEVDRFMTLLKKQWKEKHIEEKALRAALPDVNLMISAGDDNPLSNFLLTKGIKFSDFYIDMNSSPSTGLNGESHIYNFSRDSLMLDTIYMDIEQDVDGVQFISGATAKNRPWQKAFDVSVNGLLTTNKAQILVEYLNEKKEQGVYLGMIADLYKNGLNLHFYPEHPTIVFKPVNLNLDNYIFLSDKGQIKGNVRMQDDKGSGLAFYSNDADSTNIQDLTLELNNISLAQVRKVLPYMPNMEGNAFASAHYVRTKSQLSVSSDVRVDSFKYENTALGNWEMSGVYLPNEHGEHHIDGYLMKDDNEIASVSGLYIESSSGEGSVSGDLSLNNFPLDIINPFMPDRNLQMYGDVDGVLDMKGKPSNPIFNGAMSLDSVSIEMPQLSAKFRFDEKKVEMVNNKLLFNNYNIYTKGTNPFTIDGYVDFVSFTNFDKMNLNLKMNAKNFELFNSKKTRRSIIYGKMYVDFNSTLSGAINELKMRGNVNVLGNTDCTYVMQDSPLVVEDRLSDIVTFVNFNDTTTVEKKELPTVSINGMDIALTMHIEQAVQAKIDITPDGSNYMQLEGGGDLAFQYTPQGTMLLNGRYSLISGQMKYQIPIIPLKTFNIQNGSYVEWNGNPMNPTLNITAIETVRATVNSGDDNGRSVSFDVGIEIDKTMENPGLTFILSAPEDAAVQDELNAMAAEERGKLAVSMLVTGMYMAPGNSSGSGFNVNNTLNAFLQGEISNIVGKTLDINVGMETVDKGEGGSQTDYNFQLAKRFWNNRFRIVIGGRVSTGNTAQQDESFIDNVSIEYRLDTSGTRYVKLFHDKNYDSVLEGEIVETGVGIVLRRKVNRLGELFIFKKKK